MIKDNLVLYAPAKLNLSLKIVGKKDNGYHLISSHIVFLDLKDVIVLNKSMKNSLSLSGPMCSQISQNHNQNLVLKALELLQKRDFTNECYNVHLEKNIPVSAGLGGGSADAAAIIRYFNENNSVCKLNELSDFLLELGSDVPSCYYSEPMLISGVGENIKLDRSFNDEPSTEVGVVIVNPNVPISTKEIFSKLNFDPSRVEKKHFPVIPNLNYVDGAIKALQYGNDLLHVTKKICPKINEILNCLKDLNNCRGVGMSGSGPTCFALFDSKISALNAINEIHINNLFENYWTWCGGLYSQINNL